MSANIDRGAFDVYVAPAWKIPRGVFLRTRKIPARVEIKLLFLPELRNRLQVSALAVMLCASCCPRTMRPKTLPIAIVLFLVCNCAVAAQAQFYAGVMGGVATLSGDSRSLLGTSSSFASYDPKNGPAVEVLVGRHLSDYFTVQGEYIWNSNTLILTGAALSNSGQQSYQESRSSSQQSVLADLLIYFRKRGSRLRPFLSVGTGFVHLASSQQQITQLIGAPILPPQHFSSNMAALHVPVGLDVKLTKGWVFRFSFSETLTSNPISAQLSPPGLHRLQNFQNLFGIIKVF